MINYQTFEMAHAMLAPLRWGARRMRFQMELPTILFGENEITKRLTAGIEIFEDLTKRYGKPEFGIDETRIHGLPVPVREEVVLEKPFCQLLHFDRDEKVCGKRYDPKVLIVAPMSGHYATLLRGTVKAMIQEHNTYITDWIDAREVSVHDGEFGFEDYVDYLIEFIRFLGPNTHVIAVCQPSVPALVAAAVMGAADDPCAPASLTMMGGPIDTRRNPTVVNKLAEEKSIAWFENNVITHVPFPQRGFMRPVYPGYIQLTGFMTMNLDRHISAHQKLFDHLVKGDCDSVDQHRKFYEEYMAVMDLPAEFYLETVEKVFQEHLLPKGELTHRGQKVDCAAITRTAIMTVEGENDDICGLGQTEAAQDLCTSVSTDEKYHYVQPGVGHYGVFNGTRWRTEIQPRIREFIRTIQFKRMTGSDKSVYGLPYRTLREDREPEMDWRDVGN
jgi:poly(3-hydroxybutyrate) depolymerase